MVPFVMEIALRSPIILGYRTMLDSLLVGLGYERHGAASSVAHDLPLLRKHGVLIHGSQMLIGATDAPVARSTTMIQSFVRVLTNEHVVTDMLDKQPAASLINPGTGPHSNIENSYMTYTIPRVYFLGVGDVPRIRSLTLTMAHIGSQAHKGHGEVEHVAVTEVDADPTWFGIIGQHRGQNVVLRPVPKRLLGSLPRDVYGFDNEETWSYPYFRGHPRAVVEPCLVPPFTHGYGFHRETIRRFYSRK